MMSLINLQDKIFEAMDRNRHQYVSCNGFSSTMKLIRFGVPQGSILGPILFLIFINDLPPAAPLLYFLLFADDTNIFASHKSYAVLMDLMTHELKSVNDWFLTNKPINSH